MEVRFTVSCSLAYFRPFTQLPRPAAGWLRALGALTVVLLVLTQCRVAPAQSQATLDAARVEELTPEIIETRRKEAESSVTMDEATRKRALEQYQRAADELVAAAAAKSRRMEHEQAISAAPEEQQKLRQELDQPAPEAAVVGNAAQTLTDLEQQLSTQETDLAKLRSQLAAQEAEPQRRADRRIEVSKQMEALTEQFNNTQRELALPPPAEGHPEMAAATRAFLTARKQNLTAQQVDLETELRRYDATAALLPLRRDVAARRVSLSAAQLQARQELLNDKRRQDAARQAELATQSAAHGHPAVRRIAEENAKLAEQRTQMAGHIEHALNSKELVEHELKQLNDQYSDVMEKVKLVGLTDANGAVLRKQRELLPNLRTHQAAVREREIQIGNVQLDRLELEAKSDELANLDARVKSVGFSLEDSVDELSRGAIQFAARELLILQRETLYSLLSDNNSHFKALAELQSEEEKLIDATRKFSDYIDENVLWIRSANVLAPETAGGAWDAAKWLFDPEKWAELARRLGEDCRRYHVLNVGALVVFILAYRVGRQLRKRLRAMGELVVKSHVTDFHPTPTAILLTFLISVQWPALLWYVSWRLEHAADVTEFDLGCAVGLRLTALLYLTMEFFRQVCRRHGVADAHFNWPQTSLSIISRNMRWLMFVLLPMAFVVSALEYSDIDPLQDSLGRLAFIVGLVALALFMHRVLRPKRGALAETYLRNPLRFSSRLQNVWHAIGVGAPIVLTALAAAGYFYTALQLTWRLEATIWLIVTLLIVTSVFLRWVQLARRAIAIRQAMERRAAKTESAPGATNEIPTTPPATLDLSFLSQQARRLLQSGIGLAALVGIWLIWVDVLPALRVLHKVEVWKVSDNVVALNAVANPMSTTATKATPANDAASEAAEESDKSVTLADLLGAIMIATMAIIAAKNLPGLLEFTVLQRLPVESGAKFAIKTVASYLISVIGIVWTLKTIGVAWTHVQWLVAAISVGLGFGLQEIFGNFVSGLIILFERPVRVGDIVTVGQITGSVSRIQIRATTITDGDRRELIVPNKDFITGQIVNWTLSDTITRVVLPVGVAYDADAELAHKLLMQVARENAWVMKDPEPMAVMIGLGESALNFELRVFIATRDQHAPLVHSLNTTIAKVFQAHGIEIAFPQRDLHIRTVNGTPALMAPAENGAATKKKDKSAA